MSFEHLGVTDSLAQVDPDAQTEAKFVQSQEQGAGPSNSPPPSSNSSPSLASRTLWMGDLEPWWVEENIIQLWQQLGQSVRVKLIRSRHNRSPNPNSSLPPPQNAGYCFVEFERHEDALHALALNGSIVPRSSGRLFRLNWASGPTLQSQVPPTPQYSLFVGDLSPSTTEAHLLALFQPNYSSIQSVRVMTDPATGSSRCFGFVRFTEEEDRQRALHEMSGIWLGGRPIRVALATPRGAGHQPVQMQQHLQYAPSAPMVPQFAGNNNSSRNIYNDPTNSTVFVGGLAAGVSEETLFTLFEPFGSISSIKIPRGKGCGFVKFSTREEAENAISGMHGFLIGGSRVRLSWGRSSLPNQHSHSHPHPQHLMMSPGVFDPMGRNGGMYGIPPGVAPGVLPGITPIYYPTDSQVYSEMDPGQYSGPYMVQSPVGSSIGGPSITGNGSMGATSKEAPASSSATTVSPSKSLEESEETATSPILSAKEPAPPSSPNTNLSGANSPELASPTVSP
ncbi:BA75_00840T0 [Komagataella pastoris]|uniref:BA75_00840T0 n=1 Tax=Komagataella pastoris TaxID=4922 RepID=A0A1B2J5M5_PICPA|nr:BA75_00840T0 [Komagataella pastoris]